MDLDAGQDAGELRKNPRGHSRAAIPQPVADPVAPNGMHAWVGEDDLQRGWDRRIPLLRRPDVLAYRRKHGLLDRVREQRRAQIPFAEVGEHDDDELSGVFGTPGHLQRSHRGRTRGNTG